MSDTNPVGRPPIADPADKRVTINFTAAELARLDAQPGHSRRDKIMRAIDAQEPTP